MYKDQFNILFISHVEFGIQISLYHFHFTLLETVCFGCLIGSKNLTPNLFCSMLDSKFWLYNGDSRSNQRSNQSHTCSAREFVKKPTRFLDMMTSLSNKKLTTANIEMSGKMLENPYVELFKICFLVNIWFSISVCIKSWFSFFILTMGLDQSAAVKVKQSST